MNADAETGYDFIKHKKGAVFMRKSLRFPDKLSGNRAGTGFRSDRLDKDGCGAAIQLVQFELPLQILDIIGEEFIRVLENKIGTPRDCSPLVPGMRMPYAI